MEVGGLDGGVDAIEDLTGGGSLRDASSTSDGSGNLGGRSHDHTESSLEASTKIAPESELLQLGFILALRHGELSSVVLPLVTHIGPVGLHIRDGASLLLRHGRSFSRGLRLGSGKGLLRSSLVRLGRSSSSSGGLSIFTQMILNLVGHLSGFSSNFVGPILNLTSDI